MARSRDSDNGEGFLGRWARRKQENSALVPDDASDRDGMEGEAGAAPADPDAPLSEEQVQALPDPESLAAGDDWSVFMKKGVPEELQRRALRRMWRLDPKFNFLDGMDDYALDYTDAATVVAGLKSLYQVGRGMVTEEETAAEAAEAAESGRERGDGADKASTGQEAAATHDDTDPEAPEAAATSAADMPDDVSSASAEKSQPASGEASLPSSSALSRDRQGKEGSPRPAGTAVQRRWGRFST